AVADHGHVERLHHAGDLVPIGRPRKHLRARAGVQRERLGTRLAAAQRDADGVALRLIPAAADLHRHGEMGRAAHRPDDRLDETEVLETSRSAVVFHYLLDWAPEADV